MHSYLSSEKEGNSLERYAIFAQKWDFGVKRTGILDVSFRERAGKSRILVSLWVFKAKSYYFSFWGSTRRNKGENKTLSYPF